jgi:hypothetical protein
VICGEPTNLEIGVHVRRRFSLPNVGPSLRPCTCPMGEARKEGESRELHAGGDLLRRLRRGRRSSRG